MIEKKKKKGKNLQVNQGSRPVPVHQMVLGHPENTSNK